MEPMNAAIIGCGNISGIYFTNLTQRYTNIAIVACADLAHEKAEQKAQEFQIPMVCSTDDIFSDDSIELVIVLTTPESHGSLALRALEAGKHVYLEKPLALTLEQGEQIITRAKQQGLLVGCAPDTFLGGGIQTCRKLIEEGAIGEVLGGTAYMMGHGHESWHPDPEFYYKKGGGPLFDMGPYYLTALINLVGPVTDLFGATKTTFSHRTITSEPKHGQQIEVEVPTHLTALLFFENGAQITITTSFDVWRHGHSNIELYGTEGSLVVPNPNNFTGNVKLFKPGMEDWETIPVTLGHTENSRGIGPSDLAYAAKNKRPHRASGNLALHVLDIMEGVHVSAETRAIYRVRNRIEKPEPMPAGEFNS